MSSIREAAAKPARWHWLGPISSRIGAFWAGAASGAVATACVASVAFMLLSPVPVSPLEQDLLSAHLRSLMSDRPFDVASSDHHTVKPWFAGRTDVSPPVADFSGAGFPLVGGRVDYIDGHRAAVVVYRHGAHMVNFFAWADSKQRLPGKFTRNGYHFVSWHEGGLDYCAASDTALDELLTFTNLLRPMTAAEARE